MSSKILQLRQRVVVAGFDDGNWSYVQFFVTFWVTQISESYWDTLLTVIPISELNMNTCLLRSTLHKDTLAAMTSVFELGYSLISPRVAKCNNKMFHIYCTVYTLHDLTKICQPLTKWLITPRIYENIANR